MDGDEVFLTGATGFIGRHVLDTLLGSGYRVRALVRPSSRPLPALEGCTTVTGDLSQSGELVRSMAGCRYLMHVAALYSFAPRRRPEMEVVNVKGCAGLLEAARIAGVERAVVTSSSATVGPAHDTHPATEKDWPEESASASAYHASKVRQARVALAARLPMVLVLPTAPIGPGDWKPTPTGKMVLDFLRGRMFARLGEGGMNLVAVEDVARAHVLALQRGQPRERYLIGGENVSFAQIWALLADICGRKAPTHRIPYALALGLGWADELRCRLAPGEVAPLVPLEGVRMARHAMYVRCDKANAALGYVPSPVEPALERAVRWYRENGYAS